MGSLVSGNLLTSSKGKETIFVSIENSVEFSSRYMLICLAVPIPGPRALSFLSRALLWHNRPVDVTHLVTLVLLTSLYLPNFHHIFFLQLQEVREALWFSHLLFLRLPKQLTKVSQSLTPVDGELYWFSKTQLK